MNCKKCGESMHPKQAVCLKCGTATDYWQGGATKLDEDKKPIPWKIVGPIIGVLAALLVFWIVLAITRVPPPDEVTQNWMRCLASYKCKDATQYTLPQFEGSGPDQTTSQRLCDEYMMFMKDYNADYKVSAPAYEQPAKPVSAVVTLTMAGDEGHQMVGTVHLIRTKNGWKIDSVNSSGQVNNQ